MARKDARTLREEAARASADGKHRRALDCYLELERLEPADPSWPKRVAEIYRRLGKNAEAVAAYERTIDRYVRGGFLVQAIAVCKIVLQIEPAHASTQDRLAEISEQQAAGQSRFGALADRHRSLHGIPAVEMLRAAEVADRGLDRRRRPSSLPPDEPMQIERTTSDELTAVPIDVAPAVTLAPLSAVTGQDLPPIAPVVPPPTGQLPVLGPQAPPARAATAPIPVAPPEATPAARGLPEAIMPGDEPAVARRRPRRMSSGPVYLSPGAPLASVPLATILPGAADPHPRDDGSQSGVFVIPIDEDPIYELSPSEIDDADDDADTVDVSQRTAVVPSDGLAGHGLDIAIDVAPAIEAAPPIVRAPRAPTLDELDEVEEDPVVDASVELDEGDGEDPHELSVEDLEEVSDPALRGPYTATARRALASTPLFSSLPAAALEQLIERIQLVDLEPGQVLFHQGDPGDNLYVVVEGAVLVYNEGPPRTELMVLGPGSFFGEIALVTDHPRSATVEVEQPTQLLSIDRDAVRALMRDHPDVLPVLLRFVRERLVDSLVRTHPMFAPFGDPDRRYLVGRFRFVEIEPGTVFVEQGAKVTGLYVLMAGRADILRDGAVVASQGAGDMVGETSVLDHSNSPVTVKAAVRCLALFLPRHDFHEIIMTHPQVLSYIGDLADERTRAWAAVNPETMRVKMV
ncbi:MAG TPA: cyclic nucleotide-binding domain-containing protein [Kofleriaceae bacterium]|nr:cyclic nucleotide-binding domain-containing protein [Kofleriaceae bacterium]